MDAINSSHSRLGPTARMPLMRSRSRAARSQTEKSPGSPIKPLCASKDGACMRPEEEAIIRAACVEEGGAATKWFISGSEEEQEEEKEEEQEEEEVTRLPRRAGGRACGGL
jgi:hypothetical protein